MNLKAERLNRGLSVNDAAEVIGVPPHVVRTAESGVQPRPETAKRFADFYGCRVTDIWPVEAPEGAAA